MNTRSIALVLLFIVMQFCAANLFAQGDPGVNYGSQGSTGQYPPPTGTYAQGYSDGTYATKSNYWWAGSSFCLGCTVGGFTPIPVDKMMWGVPCVTAAAGSVPIVVAAVVEPQPEPYMMMSASTKGQEYSNGFREGYSRAQKKKNISAATTGMGVATLVGVLAAFLMVSASY